MVAFAGYWGAGQCMRPYVGTTEAHSVPVYSLCILSKIRSQLRDAMMADPRSFILLDGEELK